MAIGTVNVGGSGGLPLNVRFQMVEPVEKTGLWVKKDLTKAPPIYLLDYKKRPLTVSSGSNSSNALYYTIEMDKRYIFANTSTGATLRVLNKQNGALGNANWTNEPTGTVRGKGFSIGDKLYLPRLRNASSKMFCYDFENETIEELPFISELGTDTAEMAYYYDGYAYIFKVYSASRAHAAKVNLENSNITLMDSIIKFEYDDGIAQIKDDLYFSVGNDLVKYNLQTQIRTILGPSERVKISHGSIDGNYLFGNKLNKMWVYDIKSNEWINTDMSFNRYGAFGTTYNYHVELSDNNIFQFQKSETFASDLLLIGTSYNSSIKTDLIEVEGELNELYKVCFDYVKLFLNNQPQNTEIYFGDGNQFIPFNEREVI